MAEGYKDFTTGAVLTAAELEEYCELQATLRFASAAARDTALSGVLTEGLRAFLKDTNTTTVYSGSAWSTIGPEFGAWTSHTPVVTQSGTVTCNVNNSTYMRVGRMVHWRWTLTVTGSGTGSNVITLTVPANIAYVSDHAQCGEGQIYDVSATQLYLGKVVPAAAGTIKIQYPASGAPAFLGLTGFTGGLAVSDILSGWCIYEAASD